WRDRSGPGQHRAEQEWAIAGPRILLPFAYYHFLPPFYTPCPYPGSSIGSPSSGPVGWRCGSASESSGSWAHTGGVFESSDRVVVSCCPVVIAVLPKAKGPSPGVWMMSLVVISPGVRLHHQLAAGKEMPTLIRSRPSRRQASDTTGEVSLAERMAALNANIT